MIISIIAAIDENGGIGKDNQLPWHLPSDLKRFKKLTMGHHIVMGRKTYETIGKPLPGRKTIIITHQVKYAASGCQVASSVEEAIKLAEVVNEEELFIIGGGEIFQQTMNLVDKIYLTTVHDAVDADVFFPHYDPDHWEQIDFEECNNEEEFGSDFRILRRKQSPEG